MKPLFSFFCWLISFSVQAQVAINANGTPASANTMLDVQSTTKGMKIPRMTAAERVAIPVGIADAGMLVYDLTKKTLYMFDGKLWLPFAIGGSASDIRPEPVSGISQNGQLGSSCAVNGDYAVIGAPVDSANNIAYSGSVVMFQKINGSWIQKSKLTPPDAQAGDNFGYSVALEGDNLVIGAVGSKTGNVSQGAVYFYIRNGDNWNYQQKIYANDGEAYAEFGNAIALNGTTLYVGSHQKDVNGKNNQGVVYVLNRSGNNWLHAVQLKANDGVAGDLFGKSVSSSGNTVVVGASYTTNTNFGQGSIYIFIKNLGSYSLQKKISYPGANSTIYYGSSVSIEGEFIAVGAMYGGISSDDSRGLVFIYKRTGTDWIQEDYIYPSTESKIMHFGANVILRNGLLVVAAPYESVDGFKGRGAVYIYKYDPNQPVNVYRRIIDVDGLDFNYFGSAIDISGNDIIIGAKGARSGNLVNGSQGKIFFGQIIN